MPLFLSKFDNKVDKKGRVSVPAPFRATLAGQSFPGIVAYPSIGQAQCIEGCDIAYMERLSESIEEFPPFSDEYEAFATKILGGAHQLSFDSEGRIVLPDPLLSYSGIAARALFVWRGKTFQIWEPEAFRVFEETAAKIAREKRNLLFVARRPGGGDR